MKKFFLIAILMASLAKGAVTNLRVLGVTSTQAIISYTAPNQSACTVELSKSSLYTPLEKDVDPSFYSGANSDARSGNISLGRYRLVVLGKQGDAAIEQALTGFNLSRALQADAYYYFRATCGADTGTATFKTANIQLGDSRGQALLVASPWKYKQVTQNRIQNPEFADPYTGALVKNPAALLGFAYAASTGTADHNPVGCGVTLSGVKGSCKFTNASGTNWTATTGTLDDAITADDDNYLVYSGTTQDKLFIRLGTTGKYPTNSTTGQTLSSQNLHFIIKTSDTTGGGDQGRLCITNNGATCSSPVKNVTLTTAEAIYSICDDSPCTIKDNPGDVMAADLGGLVPGAARVYNESGSLTTLKFAGSNALTACNELITGEYLQVYDSRTNAIDPYFIQVSSKSCGSSPPQVTIPSGYDLAHNGTTGVTYWRDDGLAGPRFGVLFWKHSTTSSATISIDLPLWRAVTAVPFTLAVGSGGFGKNCQIPPTAGGYRLCMTGQENNQIVGLKTLADGTLDIVNYGNAHFRGDLINAGLTNAYNYKIRLAAENDSPWDDEVPGVFYATFNSVAGCGPVIVKMTMSLAIPAAPDPDGTFPLGSRIRPVQLSDATILTPCGSGASDFSLNTQRGRISSEWISKGSMFGSCNIAGIQGLTLIETCKAGEQDSHGFMFAYDLGNRLPAGAGFVGTRGGNTQQAFGGFLVPANPASRWCGNHTYQNPVTPTGSPFALMELGTKAPMYFTLDTTLSACNSRSTPGTCDPCSPGADLIVDGFNYRDKNWCATINISSSCASVSAPVGCTDGDPVSSGSSESPNLKWYQGLAVGDVIKYGSEHMKTLVKNSQTQWKVLRGWGYQSSDASADTFAPISISSGATMSTYCGGSNKDPLITRPGDPYGLAWYFGDDANGTNSLYTFLNRFQNHGWHFRNYGCFPDYTCNLFDFSVPSENKAAVTGGSFVQIPYTFAGKDTFCNGNACEKHPGAAQVVGDDRWFADLNPRMYPPSGQNAVSLMAGKTHIYQYNGAAVISPKHYDIAGFMGRWPFKRVDTLSDSASETGNMCIAIVAGDCVTGSTAGKLYFVNEIFDTTFIPLNTCRESAFGTKNGDACFGPESGMSASVTQWKVPTANGIAYLNGSRMRAVSKEWRTYRETVTENVKADPTGSTLLTRGLNYIVVPPFPGEDSRNRATFAAVYKTVKSIPQGTNNILVQFGYNASFQCSVNRSESCYAEGATINETTPFKFSHETLTGLSCTAAPCTVAVPAITNRILYSRIVYRDAGGNVIRYSQPMVEGVN